MTVLCVGLYFSRNIVMWLVCCCILFVWYWYGVMVCFWGWLMLKWLFLIVGMCDD